MDKTDVKNIALLLLDAGKSVKEVCSTYPVAERTLRRWRKEVEERRVIAATHPNQRVLFISDLHAPYQHKNAFEFLRKLKEKYKPTRVVCLGDAVDWHSLSFHTHDPDLDSPGNELKRAQEAMKELEGIFPCMDIVESNHGSLVARKAKHHGIPSALFKSLNEVYGVGDGWKWHMDLTLTLPNNEQVYVHHGKSADALKVAQQYGMHHVCGHYHESFGIKYSANPKNTVWGMNTGCLVDRNALAFAYANNNLKHQIIGTGLIVDSKPILEIMYD